MVIDDTVKTNNFAGHLKSCYLIPAIFGRHAGLEKSGANGIQTGKFFAVPKKCRAAFDLASGGDQVVNAIKFFLAQVHWHAQFPEIAVGTGYFDGLRIHVPHFGTNLPGVLISVKFPEIQPPSLLMNIKIKFSI